MAYFELLYVLFYKGTEKRKICGQFSYDFLQTYFDNPKINALAVFKGTIDGKYIS